MPFGSYTTHYTRNNYVKTLVPWAYMFVRTEHRFAYETLFKTVVSGAHDFFGVTVNLAFGSQDHAAYIASAFESVWPGILTVNCYAHLVRKAADATNKKRLKVPAFYETIVQINIRQLHSARSGAQFKALAALILAHWRKQGEHEYALWFESTYLSGRWSKWYITAAVPGITPSQNALESHHKSIMTVCADSLYASTAFVLNATVPAILTNIAISGTHKTLGHYCAGMWRGGLVQKSI